MNFAGALADGLIGRPAGTTTSVPNTAGVSGEKFVQEVQLVSAPGGVWDWLIGLYFTDEEASTIQSVLVEPGTFDLLTTNRPSQYREYAAFGNLTYYITPDFDVTVGVRISRNNVTLTETESGLFRGGVISSLDATEVKDTVETYSFSARYRPVDDHSLYARIASGYRPASARLAFMDPGGRSVNFIESDSLWSYEVGAKGQLAQGAISYDLAAWYLNWDNFQASLEFPFPVGAQLANAAGGITAKGVEGSVSIELLDGFSVISNFGYTESALNEDDPLLNGLEGQQLRFVPKWDFSSRGRYDFSLSESIDAHVGASVRYVGSKRTSFTNGDSFVPGISDPAAGPYNIGVNIPTDKYAVVDLNAGLAIEGVTLTIYAKNVFNNEAAQSASGNSQLGRYSISQLRPRTIGAVLGVDF